MSRSPGPEQRPSAPTTEEHTAERRIALSSGSSAMGAESSRDVVQEDFLFHLYRGSELLQENRVLEAKEELEFALAMQPSDPKGQDLLGTVYFRLGHYPRAIQIYGTLEQAFPDDVSIKINLALSYLKTGQPEPARRTLQDATRLNPEHPRAWGYLGLALQKLGELEQAQIAFERGGRPIMAKRVTERRQGVTMPAPPASHGWGAGVDEGVGSAAETAFLELDAGVGESPAFSHAMSQYSFRQPATLSPKAYAPVSPAAVSTRLVPPAPDAPPALSFPAALRGRQVAPSLFADASEGAVALHPGGMLLVRTSEEQPFAVKLDALRVVSGTAATRVLHRRARDADTHEVLGGLGSPMVRASGSARLVVGAKRGHALVLLALEEDLAFLREDSLVGFELRLGYENGRLALEAAGEGGRLSNDSTHVVQLRGSGAVALELTGELTSVACTAGSPLLVRREWVVGWLGRLVSQPLPSAESPSGQRGLIGFTGEGTVLLCGD